MPRRTAGKADYVLGLNKSAFDKGVKLAQKRFKSLGSSSIAIGSKLGAIGAAGGLGIAGVVKIFSDFDDQMRAVRGITGATGAEFEMLRNTAKELGRTTSFTASEVAGLQTNLARAGFGTSEITGLSGAILNLSRATGTELAEAGDIFAKTTRQFGLGADDGARVADALAGAANRSNQSVTQLGDAMSYVGPLANTAGATVEQAGAAIGVLADAGIQASMAGTSLRKIFLTLAGQGDKVKKAFNVDTKDSEGNLRSLSDVFEDIQANTAGLSNGDKLARLADVFGDRAVTAANVLAEKSGDLTGLLAEIEKAQAEGLSAKIAEDIDGGIGGAVRKTLSALEGLAIAFGEAVAGPLTAFAGVIVKITNIGTAILEKYGYIAKVILAVVAAFLIGGAVLSAFGFVAFGIASAIGFIGSALAAIPVIIGVVGSAFAGLAAFILSPFGLITAAIAGGILYFVAFTDAGKSMVQKIVDLFYSLKETVVQTFGGIFDAIKTGDLALAGQIAFTGLRVAIGKLLDAITGDFSTFIDNLFKKVKEFADKTGNFFTDIIFKISGDSALAGGVGAFIGAAGTSIASTGEKAAKRVAEIVDVDKAQQELDALIARANYAVEAKAKADEAKAALDEESDFPQVALPGLEALRAGTAIGGLGLSGIENRAFGRKEKTTTDLFEALVAVKDSLEGGFEKTADALGVSIPKFT